MPSHQPAGHQLEDHDAEAAEEGQEIRQEAVFWWQGRSCGANSSMIPSEIGKLDPPLSDPGRLHNGPGLEVEANQPRPSPRPMLPNDRRPKAQVRHPLGS